MTTDAEIDGLVKLLRGRIRDTPGYRFGDDPVIMDAEDAMLEAADTITALQARVAELEEVTRMVVELHDNNPNADHSELWRAWKFDPAGYDAARAALEKGGVVMRVVKCRGKNGYELWDGNKFIGQYPNQRLAWRAHDQIANEAKSRAEDVSDWISRKD